MNDAPIGVFDSGLGGLTVLKALLEKFPEESFIYLGDTARIPYGTKSRPTLIKYTQKCVDFLQDLKVKAVVLACNSASTVLKELTVKVPIFNVIDPGAQTAVSVTKNNLVGVLATRATVESKCYVSRIQAINPQIKVFQQAAPLLVPLVEEGWHDDPLANLVVFRYVSPLAQAGIDSLVLGCTHYPLLRNAIQKVVGNSVTLVESADALTMAMTEAIDHGSNQSEGLQLNDISILSFARTSRTGRGSFVVYVTDRPEAFRNHALPYLQPHVIRQIEAVTIE